MCTFRKKAAKILLGAIAFMLLHVFVPHEHHLGDVTGHDHTYLSVEEHAKYHNTTHELSYKENLNHFLFHLIVHVEHQQVSHELCVSRSSNPVLGCFFPLSLSANEPERLPLDSDFFTCYAFPNYRQPTIAGAFLRGPPQGV